MSTTTHFGVIKQCFHLLKNHKLLGVGPMHFAYYYNEWASHPYYVLLMIAVEWGIPAALIATVIFFWGFYERWQGGFLFPAEGFDLFFLCVISSFAVVNTPWLFFHLVLCIPKHRRWIQKMNEELKCRMKEQ